jgi:nucleoside 2-deoxyribosyltransferase
MFRKEPQAFIALPAETVSSGLRSVIEKTLDRYSVTHTSADADPSASSTSPAIQEMLREADFVIADITGANPNVMIEVGMALGMGKRLLLLSQSRSKELPFDLAATQVAVYRPENVGSVEKYLELWLRDALSDRESARS